MFGSRGDGPRHADAPSRLKAWVSARFALGPEETIVLSQRVPSLPGFPPVATVVAFWTADGARHHFSVFKPVEEVLEEDLPPAWLKAALADSEGSCACC